jgi:hypothetical protein
MSQIDPTERIDLTGLWAGFGFQAGHMFTPEGHNLEVQDMVWWSLTCNIAREWRLMMEQARSDNTRASARKSSNNVILLRDALEARRQKRFRGGDPGPVAEPSNVVYMRRGPRPSLRG